MRKHLIFSFMLGLLFLSASAQQPVNEERLAKAEEMGNVLFESVLKDADMIIFQKSRQQYAKKYWTLKFENGAVFNVYEGSNADTILGHVWWIGKRYVVYCEKPAGMITGVFVECLKNQKNTTRLIAKEIEQCLN